MNLKTFELRLQTLIVFVLCDKYLCLLRLWYLISMFKVSV